MITSVDKFLLSLLPAVTMGGAYLGFDVSAEWYQAAVTAVAPMLVWLIPNKT